MNPINKAEEILSNIKKVVFGEELPNTAAPVQPVQFSEYQLADGSTVQIDKMEVGGAVMVNDAPVMDGEYQLADGTKMEVVGGLIAEISAPEMPEAAPEVDMTAQFAAIETRLQGFESALSAARQENADLKAAFTKQEELNQHFIKMFETMIKEPNTTPTESVKNGFKRQSAEDKNDKLTRLINLFNKEK